MKNFISMFLVGVIVVGHGFVNHNFNSGLQKRMMAKKAAVVDIQKQTNGKNFKIISENFDGEVFTVTAEY